MADDQVDVRHKNADQDEEKIVQDLSEERVGREAEHDAGDDISEGVTDPWEVHFEAGEKINPKVGTLSIVHRRLISELGSQVPLVLDFRVGPAYSQLHILIIDTFGYC